MSTLGLIKRVRLHELVRVVCEREGVPAPWVQSNRAYKRVYHRLWTRAKRGHAEDISPPHHGPLAVPLTAEERIARRRATRRKVERRRQRELTQFGSRLRGFAEAFAGPAATMVEIVRRNERAWLEHAIERMHAANG